MAQDIIARALALRALKELAEGPTHPITDEDVLEAFSECGIFDPAVSDTNNYYVSNKNEIYILEGGK